MRTSNQPAGETADGRSCTGALLLGAAVFVAWALPGHLTAHPAGATSDEPRARMESHAPVAGLQERPYERLYREGLIAFWSGRWNDALTLLQRAVEAQPQAHAEPRVRILGEREMPYLPHFFLGQANFERGACRAALAAWEESLRQGVVSGVNLILLRNRRDECFQRVAPGMTAEVQALIDRASGLQEDLAELQEGSALAGRWSREPSLGPKQEEATDHLARARTHLDEGQVVWGMRMLELAGEEARRAVSLLEEVRDEARRILAETPAGSTPPDPAVQEAAAQAREKIRAAEEAARDLDPLRRDPVLRDAWASDGDLGAREAEAVEQLSAALAAVRDGETDGDLALIEEAGDDAARAARRFEALREDAAARRNELAASSPSEPPGDDPSRSSTDGSGGDPDATTPGDAATTRDSGAGDGSGADTDPGTAGVPPRLIDAARTLLVERQYGRVVTMLQGAEDEFGSTRALAHALLFRAAARHALYLLGGERQGDLLEAARRDVRACRRADPRLQPLEGYFSPRFLSFFEASTDR